jgi:hypothetical protein
MMMHDKYPRKIKETGEKISIHRLICYKCKKTIAILPDFLLPYKQYSANEIEAVLIDAETTSVYDIETEASVYTVRLWVKTLHLEATDTGLHIRLKTPENLTPYNKVVLGRETKKLGGKAI